MTDGSTATGADEHLDSADRGPSRLRFDRPPDRVAIVMLSALGDSVHVLPVANAIRRTWPDTRLTWVIQPVPYKLVAHHPAISDFIVFDRRPGLRVLRSYAELRRRFAHRRFDLLLGLQVYLKAGLITWLARADVKLGFDRARARDANWLFTTHKIPASPAKHVQDQYFEFLDYLGIDPHPIEWKLELNNEERQRQRSFLGQFDKPAAAIVVGSSKPNKDWPIDKYVRVIEALDNQFGFRPVIVGGPAPSERRTAEHVMARAGVPVVNALSDNPRWLLTVIEGARLLISPDTGPLHIARAVGTPVIGLYGYTNPNRSGPYRGFTDLVVDGYARYPGESCDPGLGYRPDGMGRVTVDAVLEKVELAVRTYVSGSGPRPAPVDAEPTG